MDDINGALLADLRGLTLFSALKKKATLRSFQRLLDLLSIPSSHRGPRNAVALMDAWSTFIHTLTLDSEAPSLFSSVNRVVVLADNVFTRTAEKFPLDRIDPRLLRIAALDLDKLGRIAVCDLQRIADTLAARLRDEGFLAAAKSIVAEAAALREEPAAPDSSPPREASKGETSIWEGSVFSFPRDGHWASHITAWADHLRERGAGLLGLYPSFIWDSSRKVGTLRPVKNPDPISLDDLSGYEEQRSIVMANTQRFAEGKPANNLLLYGDRGTGKSATVKAVCAHFADAALRLVEVRKKDLLHFERIADTLAERALRFVLFIDDLSFEQTDDTFTGLKALLEGGAEKRPDNVVIYGTSNRRHLVKERFADRPTTAMAADAIATGDVRAFDTMQEQLSLADRFGVTVVFSSPNQDEYLAIAEAIAERRGILSPGETGERQKFRENALRWERWFNGRSPRSAQQYVDWIAGGEGFPWE